MPRLGKNYIWLGDYVSEALLGWCLFVLMLNTALMQRIYGKHAALVNKVTGVILIVLGGMIFISG